MGAAHTGHGLGIRQDLEGTGEGDGFDLEPYLCNERLDDGAHLVTAYAPAVGWGIWGGTPGDVGHFEIDLGEFGLSVLATVLVAETPGELEILVHCAGADEELLGLLRGLREGVEQGGIAGAHPCWDEELTRALWRRLEEEGRLDLEKAWDGEWRAVRGGDTHRGHGARRGRGARHGCGDGCCLRGRSGAGRGSGSGP